MTAGMRKAAQGPISKDEAAALFGVLDAFPVLLLAVSGGPDSTAMMWLAARWRDGLKQSPKLVAVTVDHGLRKESAREARSVAKLASKLNIKHHTLRWIGRKPKTGIQEAARNARYRLLAAAANESGARHVLTAHTLDDQAETVLFRMARGSGVAGLAGMGSDVAMPGTGGVRLLRPLLAIPKSRLLATLKLANVSFADDPSNRDPRFTRPRLRELMPLLAAEGLDARRLAILARRMARADKSLDQVVDDMMSRATIAPASIIFDRLSDAPAEVALRALGRAIEQLGEGPVELAKLEAVHASLEQAPSAGATLRRTLAGAMMTLSGCRLTVERAPPRRKAEKARSKPSFTKPR